jgi:hypothetical protein
MVGRYVHMVRTYTYTYIHTYIRIQGACAHTVVVNGRYVYIMVCTHGVYEEVNAHIHTHTYIHTYIHIQGACAQLGGMMRMYSSRVERSGQSGLLASDQGTYLLCEECTVTKNRGRGICVQLQATAEVLGSLISENEVEGLLVSGVCVYACMCVYVCMCEVLGSLISENEVEGLLVSGVCVYVCMYVCMCMCVCVCEVLGSLISENEVEGLLVSGVCVLACVYVCMCD